MDIRTYYSTSRLDWMCWNLVNTWPFIIFHLFKRYLNVKGSSISGPAICTSVSLATLTPRKFNSWQKWLFHLLQIQWEPAPRSPFASFTYVALSWKTFFNRFTLLHKRRCSCPYHIPRSLIVPFKYSSFSFLKCLLVSYFTLFRSFTKIWLRYCNHCNLACVLWSKSFKKSSPNHGLLYFYISNRHINPDLFPHTGISHLARHSTRT